MWFDRILDIIQDINRWIIIQLDLPSQAMSLNLGSGLNVNRLIARWWHPGTSRSIYGRLGSIVVGERCSPLTCPTNPYVLLRDGHNGDPEQFKPCSVLGSENGSIVTTRTQTQILFSFRFNLRLTSANNRNAKEHGWDSIAGPMQQVKLLWYMYKQCCAGAAVTDDI